MQPMDLRTILAMAQQQQSIPGLLAMLRGGFQQGNRRRAVPQPVSGGGGGGAVPPPVSSTMAASNAMSDMDFPQAEGKGIFSWGGHDPRLPLGPVTQNPDGSRVGVPVEGTDRYKLPDGSFSESYDKSGATNWFSELHRPTSDPMSAGSFRPAPSFGPGYYWSTTGELGIPGQGQYAMSYGAGGPGGN